MTVETIQVDAGAYTDVGRSRQRNEDSHALYDSPHPAGRLYVVADGVGGESHGDKASQHTVKRAGELFYEMAQRYPNATPEELLSSTLVQINQEICDWSKRLGATGHMGTTGVLALLRGNVLTVGWVGDSRAYVVSRAKGIARQITTDHTESEEQVRAGMLSPQEARNHPRRNVLSRSLGGDYDVEPEVRSGALDMGDVVVICSDGLSRYLGPEDIAQFSLNANSSQQAAERMGALANQRGGKDNITAVVVYIGERESEAETNMDPPTAPMRPGTAKPGTKGLLDDWRIVGVGVAAIFALILAAGLLLMGGDGQSAMPTAAALNPSPEATVEAIPEESLALTATQSVVSINETYEAIAVPITQTQEAVLQSTSVLEQAETRVVENQTAIPLTETRIAEQTAEAEAEAATATRIAQATANAEVLAAGRYPVGMTLYVVVDNTGVLYSVDNTVTDDFLTLGSQVVVQDADPHYYEYGNNLFYLIRDQATGANGWVNGANLSRTNPAAAAPVVNPEVTEDVSLPAESGSGQVIGGNPGVERPNDPTAPPAPGNELGTPTGG